jgi:hypothetical protein
MAVSEAICPQNPFNAGCAPGDLDFLFFDVNLHTDK